MPQTLNPPVQSTQNSNTSNQYVPRTPNQAMLNSTKQQVLTQNHIQPPPGFQQQQSQQVSQQRYAPTLPTQNQLTQQVYTQALPTPVSIQQQQHNLQTPLNQKTTSKQQYTIQLLQNASHLGQVHQQTQLRDVPCQILQDIPCQNACVAPALMQDLTPGLTDQVSPTLLHGSNIPPPGAGLTVTGSICIQYQVNPAKLQGGYEPLMASASTESIPGNVEKISKMQMPSYNSKSVQTVDALKPLTVEVSDQGSSSLSGNILETVKASVCSDHARITQPYGSKQTLMLLQQCQQPHLQSVRAPLLALQLPSQQNVVQQPHQQIMSLSPQQQFAVRPQEQHPHMVSLNTMKKQHASVLSAQHLSTQQLALGNTDTRSSGRQEFCGDMQGVCNELAMSDLAEALTDGREQPEVFDTHEEDALLRAVQRHYVEVYQRLSTLKNHVDSLVTDMQTIRKGMEAIDLEQNHLKYDC